MCFRGFVRTVVCCVVVSCCCSLALAELRLPAVIGSHMVLQRGQTIPIWGWATPGDQVTVTLAGQTATATANGGGAWRVNLASLEVGDPLDMVIKTSSGDVTTLKDILVGEVWVGSGQSNMQMPVNGCKDAAQETAAADLPKIRVFTVSNIKAFGGIKDTFGQWDVCSSKNAGNFSAAAFFFGRELNKALNVPVGLINTSWGGTPIEFWMTRAALEGNEITKPLAKGYEVSCLYNAMVAPLMPYGIRGAIWYQGEANVGGAYYYRTMMPSLIANWRAAWGQGDFPFGLVQISPWCNYGDKPEGSACAELREAQSMTLTASPNTGMAVTTDLVDDIQNIHPINKQDVGHRLALWALAKVYGRDLVYSGPIYKSMAVEGNKIRLQFDHVGGGLIARDGKPLIDFTIAGEDQKFVPAVAEIDGNAVVVHSDQVASPAAVRFGWRQDSMPNLSNKEGLPASPFRTDVWKGVTQP